MINLEEYFARIGYTGDKSISFNTFKNIHTSQAFSIPFENLVFHDLSSDKNHPSRLDKKSLIEKLINNKRGGHCYETNELLALVLEQIGFKVDRLAARALDEHSTPLFHKLLLVTINDQQYIADVGFGLNSLIEPIPLKVDTEFEQYGEYFKISKEEDLFILNIKITKHWHKLYSFSLTTYLAHDYEPLNFYISQMLDSIIIKNKICTIASKSGRIMLENLCLNIRHNGKNDVIFIKEDEYLNKLNEYFSINLPLSTKFKLT